MTRDQESAAFRARIVSYYAERASRYDQESSRNWSEGSEFRERVGNFCATPLLTGSEGAVVADLGVGTGRTAADVIQTPNVRFMGVDISIPMLKAFERRTTERGKLVCGDIHALPIRRESLDGVYLVSVLQYLDLDVALTELARVTRPRAWMVVGVICLHPEDHQEWRDQAFQALVPPYLGRFHHKSKILEVFAKHGFIPQAEDRISFRRPFGDMVKDRSHNVEGATLRAGLKIFSSAPARIREIYQISDDGFTQHYWLFLFRRE